MVKKASKINTADLKKDIKSENPKCFIPCTNNTCISGRGKKQNKERTKRALHSGPAAGLACANYGEHHDEVGIVFVVQMLLGCAHFH